MNFIDLKDSPSPPEYLICPYCKRKMSSIYDQESRYLYSCDEHKPLIVDYYYTSVPPGRWINDLIIISYLDSFRLSWNYTSTVNSFSLQEYKYKKSMIVGWYGYENASFPVNWVLSQKPEKILSLLEMYRTFS